MKGDMAFFYHSNCKKPGIVGTMEIVREHSVDGMRPEPQSYCGYTMFTYTISSVCFRQGTPVLRRKVNRRQA